jgi:hypothetical protein
LYHVRVKRTLFQKFFKGFPCKRTSDFKTFTNNGRGDQLVRGDFLQQLFVRGLVEKNLVVQLITDLSLGPLLQIEDEDTLYYRQPNTSKNIKIQHLSKNQEDERELAFFLAFPPPPPPSFFFCVFWGCFDEADLASFLGA